MWHEVSSPTVHELTPQFVERFSALPTYGGDRDRESKQGKERRQWLKAKLEDDRFFSPVWSIAEYDGETYRVDGGHSSAMLHDANGSFPAGKAAVVRHFFCETHDDFADLFMQFDSRRSLRTARDKIIANRAVTVGLHSVVPSDIRTVVDGIDQLRRLKLEDAWKRTGSNRTARKLDEDERIESMHRHEEFVLWASRHIKPRKNRRLRRDGVIAAMYETMTPATEAKASIFWELVADESAVVDDPTRKLSLFLRNATVDDKTWTPRAFYCKCIHAWNAWLRHKPTSLRYFVDSPLPKCLRD